MCSTLHDPRLLLRAYCQINCTTRSRFNFKSLHDQKYDTGMICLLMESAILKRGSGGRMLYWTWAASYKLLLHHQCNIFGCIAAASVVDDDDDGAELRTNNERRGSYRRVSNSKTVMINGSVALINAIPFIRVTGAQVSRLSRNHLACPSATDTINTDGQLTSQQWSCRRPILPRHHQSAPSLTTTWAASKQRDNASTNQTINCCTTDQSRQSTSRMLWVTLATMTTCEVTDTGRRF